MKKCHIWMVGISIVVGLLIASPVLLSSWYCNLGRISVHRGLTDTSSRVMLEQGRLWLEQSNRWYENPGANEGLVRAYAALGEEEMATATIARIETLGWERPTMLWAAGQAALQFGEQERAVALWQRVGAGGYLALLAQNDFQAGRLADAQLHVELALQVDPEQALGWLVLGRLQEQAQELEEAAASYQRALEVDPDLAEASFGLAQVYQRLGETERALAELESAVRRRPQEGRSYYAAASILWQTGRYEEALTWCERGQIAAPDFWGVYVCAGETLLRLGEPARAIEQFLLADEHGADSCATQLSIGLAYRALGQFDQAVEAMKQAKCGQANIPWVYIHLARTYEQMGQPDLALAEYEAVLDLFPAAEGAVQAAREGVQRLTGVEQP